MLKLKGYQERTLDSLRLYFGLCRAESEDANTAFYKATGTTLGRNIPYTSVAELPGLPYVCIRIPTGGGKTLVASHAVGIAARELLHIDDTVALWLVPSNTIREQTLRALRDRNHPYRQALEREAGNVEVMDVAEALAAPRSRYEGTTVVLVATVQAFRVQETEGRKVYEDSGALMSHFSGLSADITDSLEKYEDGTPIRSLANVLRLRRPIVVVDEAHNSRTELSFETLARFRPSCILEFTATPNLEAKNGNTPSNVLHTVSAAELAAEDMIKMPLQVVSAHDWKRTIADAVSARAALEKIAATEQAETGEYLRPVALLQAEPNRQGAVTVTVDELKKNLLEDHKVPEDQIRIATGAKDDLGDEDLNSPDSQVRFVLTVQKLREGWDCPFAYILGTVSETRSRVAVEQLIGRIMRLPRARRKGHEELNKGYVFSRSEHLQEVISSLTDALVQNGFERQEAGELIVASQWGQTGQQDMFGGGIGNTVALPPPLEPPTAPFEDDAGLESLPPNVRDAVTFDPKTRQLTVTQPLSEEEIEAGAKCFSNAGTKKTFKDLCKKAQSLPARPRSFAEKRVPFTVPWLLVRTGEQPEFWEPFEETHLSDVPWSIKDRDSDLASMDYEYSGSSKEGGLIYMKEDGRVGSRFLNQVELENRTLISLPPLKPSDLVWWLENRIPHRDIDSGDLGIFLLKAVQHLTSQRGIQLRDLWLDKYRLLVPISRRVSEHREAARKEAYQTYLLPDTETPLVVSPDNCFRYGDEHQYPWSLRYTGGHEFKKHFYKVVGDLKASGEEFECAVFLDSHPDVEFWVRNLERRPEHSFWLQTSSDRFYPDFVAKLKDGRILVVEYKGEDRWSNDDSKEKRGLGELWAERSEGRCLFVMPKGKSFQEIDATIRS